MKNYKTALLLIALIAVLALTACGVQLQSPFVVAEQPATTGNPEPGESVGVDKPLQQQFCVGDGVFAGSPVEIGTFQDDGTYLIPRDVLLELAGNGALEFEGEQQIEGVHDVMVVVYPGGTFGQAVGENGLRVRDEGSFWALKAVLATNCLEGFRAIDDELMKLAKDKRENWTSQGMVGNPIQVWLSTGVVVYQPEEEIPLTAAQAAYVQEAAAARCQLSGPYEETPRGDPDGTAALGSYSCRTVVINPDEAFWFSGARDGVPYTTGTTRVFIIPASYSQEQMTNWVKETFGLTLRPYGE